MTKLHRRSLLKLPVCLVPLPAVVAQAAPIPLSIGVRQTLERALYIHTLYLQGRVSERTAQAAMDGYIRAKFFGLPEGQT